MSSGNDTRAWEALARERTRLVGQLVRRCGATPDVEDWAQDAILRVATTMHVDAARAPQLLLVVAWRIAVDEHRARKRRSRLRRLTVTSPQPSPIEIAEERCGVVDLMNRIARLPKRQRDVVVLVADGVPLGQAAEALGVSYRAAEGALRRARRALRADLASTGPPARTQPDDDGDVDHHLGADQGGQRSHRAAVHLHSQ